MKLKSFSGRLVTVILRPTVLVPSLDYYDSFMADKPYHLLMPADRVLRPDAAVVPQGNVVPNCVVHEVEGSVGEYDLRYRPWLTAPFPGQHDKNMQGATFTLRVHEDDVAAVMECKMAPPNEELQALALEMQAKEERQASAGVAWKPSVGAPPASDGSFLHTGFERR